MHSISDIELEVINGNQVVRKDDHLVVVGYLIIPKGEEEEKEEREGEGEESQEEQEAREEREQEEEAESGEAEEELSEEEERRLVEDNDNKTAEKELTEELKVRNIYDPRSYVLIRKKDLLKVTKEMKVQIVTQIRKDKARINNEYDNYKKAFKVNIWAKSKIKSILKDNKIKREIGNKESGSLDFKKLSKIATTGKIFKRKSLNSNKNYSVSLLVDCSGSMEGSKSRNTAISTINFIKEYHEYVDIEVVGFNMTNIPLKSFGEKVNEEMLKEIYYLIRAQMRSGISYILEYNDIECERGYYGNHDHMAIEEAYERLRFKTGNKFIIVFSDGQPACNGCWKCGRLNLNTELHRVVEVIEKTDINLFSIGIEDDCVKSYYKDYRIIQNASELSKTLVNYVASKIRRVAVR